MDSSIEAARQAQEEIDLFEQALAEILAQPDKTHRHKLEKEHRASDILDRIVARKEALVEHYEDANGLRLTEIAALAIPAPPADDLEEFYTRLTKIKDFHRKNPGPSSSQIFNTDLKELMDGPEVEEEYAVDALSSMFSGEESLGRFLDLNLYHSQYINLKGVSRIPYLGYLDHLSSEKHETAVSKKEKSSEAYTSYITSLHTCLLSFLSRTRPLENYAPILKQMEDEFNTLWDANQLEGWEIDAETSNVGGSAEGNATEGIWCPACQKLYSKQTVYDAHLKSDKHKKKAAKLLDSTSSPSTNGGPAQAQTLGDLHTARHQKLKPAGLMTFVCKQLLTSPTHLNSILQDTKSNVERRAALTARERELELEQQEAAASGSAGGNKKEAISAEAAVDGGDDDDEEKIYNPLKLPMGWDGKPIPYWLFKLHGLGVEYKCEICSDTVYMGRKNFERHFQEARHAFGMKALGLPNTKHFHEITKIEDALALAERLKQEGKQDIQLAERMEEIEDSEGNVYDKRTYDDLKRQGLI